MNKQTTVYLENKTGKISGIFIWEVFEKRFESRSRKEKKQAPNGSLKVGMDVLGFESTARPKLP